MPAPQPKPKYILKGPRPEKVITQVYSKEPGGPLEYKPVEEVKDCYMLFMPSGPNGEFNSIRITSEEQLSELGINPHDIPLIDPETGETVGSFNHRVAQDYGPDPVITNARKKGVE